MELEILAILGTFRGLLFILRNDGKDFADLEVSKALENRELISLCIDHYL